MHLFADIIMYLCHNYEVREDIYELDSIQLAI